MKNWIKESHKHALKKKKVKIKIIIKMCARNKIEGLRNIIFTFLKIIEHWNMICFSFLFLLFNFYIYIFYLISMICISHLWTPYFSCVSPLDDDTRFLFGENLIFWKILEVATYFSFFFKGKQNKKENIVWLLIWKRRVCKNRIWFRGSGYLFRRYGGEP